MNFERWRHYARGWLFHFFGRTARARGEYELAFRHDPRDAQSARHIAFIAAQDEDYDTALRWFDAALVIAPGDAATHFNRGYALQQAGRVTQAVASFGEATRLNPNLDRAWYGMGLAHAACGDHAAAIVALAEAARLQPFNGYAFYQLGMAYHHDGQPEETARVLKKLAGFDPKLARQLARDSGRDDLAQLLPKLPF
jgi:tetratricopeptide (TPR) repeat protein